MNWLERIAINDEHFRKHGAESWRTLRDAFRSVVDSYNRMYERTGPAAVFNGCRQAGDDCFRVRMVPTRNSEERYVELKFEPGLRSIVIGYFGVLSSDGEPKMIEFGPDLGLGFNGKKVTNEDLSEMVLAPLFFPAGVRPYPSNPPEDIR